jgi:fatty-acyl-CoA synthase
MSALPHIGEVVAMHARTFPQQIGASDLNRSLTFLEWNRRACRLANALLGIGLAKGDRVCILA